MTALFPTYHTPLSTGNDANLLCATVLGGGYQSSSLYFRRIQSLGFPLRDAELYDLSEVLTGIFGRLCCVYRLDDLGHQGYTKGMPLRVYH